ncbi:hypothetical protein [Aureliella helgolandensis]|uniref:Uncharacterized protein n=1 Tax=Aureliella helgolandensis TaxID=2527968 RepID=A0A518GHQ9_9BACT|nr:hypothetical protein [Aureliella helgolandensis]QDV28124.1 hypothetical protein Q31a_65190 [Aureliella helgolandensis]
MRARKSKKTAEKKDRFARQKLLAIPILLCGLAYVLFGMSGDDDNTETAYIPPTSQRKVAVEQATGSESATAVADRKGWPEVDLATLIGESPLVNYTVIRDDQQLVTTGAQTGAATRDNPLEGDSAEGDSAQRWRNALLETPVSYVFESGDRKVVMLGDQLLEKGQMLSPSVKVEDIQHGKLILSVERGEGFDEARRNQID